MDTKQVYHYVYRITNTVKNKHYYGKRSSKKLPKSDIGFYYFSSSSDVDFMKDQKNNPQNYKYKVIRTFDTSSAALAFEIKLHAKLDVGVNPSFYNKAKQTLISMDCTGVKKVVTDEFRAFLSKVHKGKTISDKQRLQISNTLKGRPSPNKGKKASEETRKKISINTTGVNNPNYGKKASAEKLEKMRKAASGINNANAKLANVYEYGTDNLIAAGVVIKEWCRSNPYDPSQLSKTARADREQSHHCAKNMHRHKGVYARYV